MKPVYLSLLLLFFFGTALRTTAQTHTPRYISMMSKTKGYYEYLPEGYDANGTATYPLILFMTGIGEFGNGTTQLPDVLKNGIPKLINAGTFPKSFTVNGQTHRFIVITPQFIKFPRPTADDMDSVLDYIVAHYKVNINRIYITGLSYGGGLSWAYAGDNRAYAQRIAAIVPIASPVPDGGDATIYARSRVIAANNVAVWATHNLRDQDDTVATTISYVNDINQPPAPTPPAKMTIFNSGGHDAWARTYDPAFKENNLNVYEWMLQYQRNLVANQPPKVSAGADQSVTLPTSQVTLAGSGSDADGSITSYAWTKVSGPASGTITSPAATTTTVTGLTAGTYVFRLTVTDNSGATATDDVTVTVNAAPNVAPQASAGADQTITLPVNQVTLRGSGADSDGSIAGYTWTKVSGPAGETITTPNAAATSVTGLVPGTYVFRLTVTDNDGATATDDVTITVNEAPNQAPVAHAGADITLTLPNNSTTLSGSGTDADGTIASYAWTKLSGPAAGSIAAPAAATTTVNNLAAGTYVFRLTVTDNKGTTATDDVSVVVNPAPNVAPQANAGPDQSITLPLNSVMLSGSGTDADGTIASYAWTKVSGPASGSIASPAAKSTTVSNLAEGTYVFRLTVKDNDGASATDEVSITINAVPNVAPVVNAGADQSITLPTNNVTLTGTATDSDGSIASYAWTKISGPAGDILAAPDGAVTSVSGLMPGVYVYRLTVTDNDGAIASDDVNITVNAAANKTPAANAGIDVSLTLPVTTTTLSGSGTDADGTITSYAWIKVSGPAQGDIITKNAAVTAVNNLLQGVYIFRLTVTDNDGAQASDDVTVTVNAAPNKAPVAHAGSDIMISLPVNTASLSGSATDEDGTITTYEWSKVSGPAGGIISSPQAAATQVTGLVQGTYSFRLTVTDNDGAAAFDDVTITVNPAANQAPVANAGADLSITLPLDSATLSGSGTDADGTIATYAWTKVSGPAQGTLATPAAAVTQVTGLAQGTYVFRLMVTDNDGATDQDDITVIVLAAPVVVNQRPQVDAGTDQSITLPPDSVQLKGTATDADGTIATYAWTQVSGPAAATIITPDSLATSITALKAGSYVFRLTVTDNSGAFASDEVKVEVTVVTAIDDSPAAAGYRVLVAPNPAASYFSMKVVSTGNKPCYLRVTDALGRVVEERRDVRSNTVFTIGHQYRAGVYYAEVVQNSKRLVVRLLKTD